MTVREQSLADLQRFLIKRLGRGVFSLGVEAVRLLIEGWD